VFNIMAHSSMQYYDKRPNLRLALICAIATIVSSCASSAIDSQVPAGTSAQSALSGPKDSGQYPNINIVPTGETAQLSDSETAATRARLEGEAQVQRQRGESPEAYLDRLRKLQKLGSTHAAATLREIEASGQ
jgi:hypothetical protein